MLRIFQGTPVSIKTGDTKTVGVPNHGKDKSIHDLVQLQLEKKLRMCIAFRVLKVQSRQTLMVLVLLVGDFNSFEKY